MKTIWSLVALLALAVPVLQGCEGCAEDERKAEREKKMLQESGAMGPDAKEEAKDEKPVNSALLWMGLTTGTVHDAQKRETEVVAKHQAKSCVTPVKSALLKQKAVPKTKPKATAKLPAAKTKTKSKGAGLPAGLPVNIPGSPF